MVWTNYKHNQAREPKLNPCTTTRTNTNNQKPKIEYRSVNSPSVSCNESFFGFCLLLAFALPFGTATLFATATIAVDNEGRISATSSRLASLSAMVCISRSKCSSLSGHIVEASMPSRVRGVQHARCDGSIGTARDIRWNKNSGCDL